MSGQNIYQVASEVDRLLELLAKSPPRKVLEIGMANGDSFREWSNVATDNAILIGIDLGVPEVAKRAKQKFHLLACNSHDQHTLETVKSILNAQPLDFLFIDGDHTYDSVKLDFAMYAPLVRPGGIIALHDIVPGPCENVGGVPIFWKELIKQTRIVMEFVNDWNQRGYGIGVLIA